MLDLAVPAGGGNWPVYPQGHDEGIIVDVEDLGMEPNPFYGTDPERPGQPERHRIGVKVESITKVDEETGIRHLIEYRCDLKSDKRSNLRIFRTAVAGRTLTEDEALRLRADELLGVRIGYVVTHNEREGKQPWANISGVHRLPPERQSDGVIYHTEAIISDMNMKRRERKEEKLRAIAAQAATQAPPPQATYQPAQQPAPVAHPPPQTQPTGGAGGSYPGVGQQGYSQAATPPAAQPNPNAHPNSTGDDDLPF